jgi:hypothetical protein
MRIVLHIPESALCILCDESLFVLRNECKVAITLAISDLFLSCHLLRLNHPLARKDQQTISRSTPASALFCSHRLFVCIVVPYREDHRICTAFPSRYKTGLSENDAVLLMLTGSPARTIACDDI